MLAGGSGCLLAIVLGNREREITICFELCQYQKMKKDRQPQSCRSPSSWPSDELIKTSRPVSFQAPRLWQLALVGMASSNNTRKTGILRFLAQGLQNFDTSVFPMGRKPQGLPFCHCGPSSLARPMALLHIASCRPHLERTRQRVQLSALSLQTPWWKSTGEISGSLLAAAFMAGRCFSKTPISLPSWAGVSPCHCRFAALGFANAITLWHTRAV